MSLRKAATGLALLATVLMTGCCCHRCCRRPLLRPCCRPACCAPSCCYPPAEPCCSDPGPILSHTLSSPAPPVADVLGARGH
jgi:hypothetical protein